MTPGADLRTAVFLTVHRGGSTFVAADLAPALCRALPGLRHVRVDLERRRGAPASTLALAPRGMIATRVYPPNLVELVERPAPDAPLVDKTVVVVRRDPRDAAVSLYWALARSHPVPAGDDGRFVARRERVRALAPAAGIAAETAATAIGEFRAATALLRVHAGALDAPYERLVTAFDAWWTDVAAALGLAADVARALRPDLAEAVRAPETEDPDRHKRRVTPGAWRDVFDDDLRARFEREIGEELAEAGYGWD